MASSLPFPDYGLNTDDIHYFHMDSVVRGRGPDRLKYLDLEGRWKLSGKSIPYISAAFNHLQRLNDASVPMRNLERAPLNAIGMVTWNSSARVPEKPEKKELTILKPEVEIREVIPPSPREVVPHRSAGYGWAHQKRKLSIPDRSRSPSVSSRNGSPTPEFDKFAKYQRKGYRNRTTPFLHDSSPDSGIGSCQITPFVVNNNELNYELVNVKARLRPVTTRVGNLVERMRAEAAETLSPTANTVEVPEIIVESKSVPDTIDDGIKVESEIDDCDREVQWILVDEKVSVIRVEETEYYYSTTTYGTRYGSHRDLGYISNEDRHSSGAPSPKDEATEHLERPPHRTQPLSPTPNAKVAHDSQYDPTYLSRDRQYADELTISVKDSSKYYSEKPIASYRDQYLRKTYELSPKSTGSTDYSSTSEQNSPNKKSPRTAEEYLLEAYHYKSTFRDEPRRSRMDWSPRY
ncbi:hypothetical protein L596_004600 [Steinernema carpocapsae]|uniref:Uncharacterized protein n=1 Tax=Steinernema carpocapsae TaxID=34508 RepID=A0A4U8UWG5_STECR|nr:hypothetical protein L596_004600 [Steinernema carpocapsae]